ncbi:MAG: HD domain-containing protein [Methanophagales archaeon ANME-1-THS]|nr:MAG: HD domain-containing protein [Methanophagales archaeon ANME-1-THS]
MQKVIRDPIHGYIELDELAIAILDTVELQRLRRIRQLGFSYLVYPGANHTRFEHSLGTYYLMNVLLDRLEVANEEEQELRAASLIHDIGHGPFSHVTELLIRRYAGRSHEAVEDLLFAEGDERPERRDADLPPATLAEVLDAYRLDTKQIVGYIKGERTGSGSKRDFSKILNGEIDVDRMDYLVRDSYYTGVAYGVVDNIRLIRGLDFVNDELVITEKGILPAEYLLFSRFLMHPAVYNHHTSRIAQLMFLNALEAFIESKVESESASKDYARQYALALRRMDDAEITTALRNAQGYPKEIMARIDERRLFKRALYINLTELDETVAEELSEEQRLKEVEEELGKRAGVPGGYLLVDFQGRKGDELEESAAKVVLGNEFKRLRDVSSLVATLSRVFQENYKFGVYTPEKYRADVKRAAESILWR